MKNLLLAFILFFSANFVHTEKIGTLVETIGWKEVPIENGLITVQFKERTEPDKSPKIECAITSDMAANFTLNLMRPDGTSGTIRIEVPAEKEGLPIHADFVVQFKQVRPSAVKIQMQKGNQPCVQLGEMTIINKKIDHLFSRQASCKEIESLVFGGDWQK